MDALGTSAWLYAYGIYTMVPQRLYAQRVDGQPRRENRTPCRNLVKQAYLIPIFTIMPQSLVYNTDCLEYMRTLPDNYFSLAIADPPYGDAGQNNANPHVDLGSRSRKYLKDTEITTPPPTTTTSCTRLRRTVRALHEQAGLGRRSTQKNPCVGHGPR